MASQNRKLNQKKGTIDPSKEIRVEVKFFECVDGLQPQSFFNLNFLVFFILHINTELKIKLAEKQKLFVPF